MHDAAPPRRQVAMPMRTVVAAWLITAVYYFYQYTLRSAPGGHDAAAVGGLRPERAGRRLAGRAVLLRLLAVQPGRRRRRWTGSGRGGSSRSARRWSASARCSSPPGNRDGRRASGRFLQGAGGVFALVGAVYIATTQLPGLARRDADRRDADVRHGRRLGRPVRRRAADRRGPALERVLDRHGRRRPRDQRACSSSCCRRSAEAAAASRRRG